MAVESMFSPEIEAAFFDWVKKSGVKVALFDFDDTLIDTNSLFGEKLDLFYLFCQNCVSDLNLDEFKSRLKELEDVTFDQMGVSVKKWPYIVGELAREYNSESISEGLEIINSIYVSAPRIFDGVKETLSIIKKSGVRLGLITHAGKAWTDIKLEEYGLRDFFENIKIIDVEEHKFKGREHWQEIVNLFGVDPEKMLAVGDNLKGDIGAAHAIGIKNLVWIPSRWSKFREGDLPMGALKVDAISDLIPTLCQQK